MIATALAALAAYGTFLLVTAVLLGWRGLRTGPRPGPRSGRLRVTTWLAQAGFAGTRPSHLAGLVVAAGGAGMLAAALALGPGLPALAVGLATATLPLGVLRQRRRARREAASEHWPRLIEEVRVRTASLGRSVPQALFEAGRHAPAELHPAFAAGQREWLLTTDFERTVAVLQHELADPTADATLETLLVAHEVGGSGLDRRLAALLDDRIADVHDRKDARAKQAGVRFARRFVVLVPAGMAFVGTQIGTGRAAYRTAAGQAAVLVALAVVAVCWWWAGRLLRLPAEERVFGR